MWRFLFRGGLGFFLKFKCFQKWRKNKLRERQCHCHKTYCDRRVVIQYYWQEKSVVTFPWRATTCSCQQSDNIFEESQTVFSFNRQTWILKKFKQGGRIPPPTNQPPYFLHGNNLVVNCKFNQQSFNHLIQVEEFKK